MKKKDQVSQRYAVKPFQVLMQTKSNLKKKSIKLHQFIALGKKTRTIEYTQYFTQSEPTP